jgi:predicted transcriptional regulator
MRNRPTIAEAYAAKRAAFVKHTPFGKLNEADEKALIRATARDAGATVAEVMKVLGHAQ